MILPILIVLVSHSPWLPAETTGKAGQSPFDPFFHRPSPNAQNDVEREFECIRFRANDPRELISSPQAMEIIKRVSGPMEDAFRRHDFTPFERALFYSQAIEESGGFTQLSEAVKYSKDGDDPIGQIIGNVDNDDHFKAKAGARHSRRFGRFRGRGLVQISRCDNYLSVIHYLNLIKAGRKPVWRTYWEIGSGESKKQLGTVCSPGDLDQFAREYRARHGMNANLYGVLDDPMRFAMIRAELKDPVSGQRVDSERFMVDASIAYWRGRCGATIRAASDIKTIDQDRRCASFKDAEYLVRAVKCVTDCVKGSQGGVERRVRWMRHALLCAR